MQKFKFLNKKLKYNKQYKVFFHIYKIFKIL